MTQTTHSSTTYSTASLDTQVVPSATVRVYVPEPGIGYHRFVEAVAAPTKKLALARARDKASAIPANGYVDHARESYTYYPAHRIDKVEVE